MVFTSLESWFELGGDVHNELADRLRMLEAVLRESHDTGMRVAQSAEELGLSVLEQDVANVIGDADLALQAADALREAVEALRQPPHETWKSTCGCLAAGPHVAEIVCVKCGEPWLQVAP